MARKTRAEVTLDKVLSDIEQGKRYQAQLVAKLQETRQGHVPEGYLRPETATPQEIQAWQDRQAVIDGLEEELARLNDELAKAWDVATGLSDPNGRLSGSGEDLERAVRALEARLSTLQARRGTFREDAHERLDIILSEFAARAENLLAGEVGHFEVEEVAKLWAFLDPAFAERLHGSVDARPAEQFAAGSRSSWEAEMDVLARQVQRRRAELQAREAERSFAEAEAARDEALAAVEAT